MLVGSALLAVSYAMSPDRVLATAVGTFAARTTWQLGTVPVA